jgi:dienelactone hydrolase
MRNEDVKYSGDGLTMHGRLYWDQTRSGPRPGVLVFPGASGINEMTYSAAVRLAEEGYVALACDYYGAGFGYDASDEELGAQYRELTADMHKVRVRAAAALDTLKKHPDTNSAKIAAIGYCFGGATALELACAGAPLAAVVAFHSVVDKVTLSDAKNIGGRVLVCNGAEDPIAPAEDRAKFEAAMRAAGIKWQLNLYGDVAHAFTDPTGGRLRNPKFGRYDGWAKHDSWEAMLRLFNEAFR